MLPTKYKIKGIFAGPIKPLPSGKLSAIRKSSQSILFIHQNGISGDQVADVKYHGGPYRVVHHYSEKNYDYLRKALPDLAPKFKMGSYGENITTEALTEADLCLGDVFTLGSAVIQVTVPRKPCATINATYEDERVLKEVAQSRRWGWFYKVLREGTCEVGDWLVFQERRFPEVNLKTLINEVLYKKEKDLEFLKKIYASDLLDENGFRAKVKKILDKT